MAQDSHELDDTKKLANDLYHTLKLISYICSDDIIGAEFEEDQTAFFIRVIQDLADGGIARFNPWHMKYVIEPYIQKYASKGDE